MNDVLERNKNSVIGFDELMFNECKPAEAIARYAVRAIQATQPARRRRKARVHRIRRAHGGRVPREARPRQALRGGGNFVVLHCRQQWPTDSNKAGAGIDIFRLNEEGKIAEHWDVLQVVPVESKNKNSMF